jgi:hypothetical protein
VLNILQCFYQLESLDSLVHLELFSLGTLFDREIQLVMSFLKWVHNRCLFPHLKIFRAIELFDSRPSIVSSAVKAFQACRQLESLFLCNSNDGSDNIYLGDDEVLPSLAITID